MATTAILALALCLCLNVVGLCRTSAAIAGASTNTNTNSSRVIRLELIPRDSPQAATSNRSASFLRSLSQNERVLRAIQRSHARAADIQRQNKARQQGYEAPVSTSNLMYLVKISIGSPPLEFPAIFDTGSDLIWTQCLPCQHCFPQPTPIFDPSTSPTFEPISYDSSFCRAIPLGRSSPDSNNNCRYFYRYLDSDSTEGVLASETLTLSGVPLEGVVFGCGHNNHEYDAHGSAGILGLGRSPLSLPSQFAGIVGSSGVSFAYCLSSLGRNSPLWVGPDAPSHFPSGADYGSTSLLLNPAFTSHYYVSISTIHVGGNLVDIPSGAFDITPDGHHGLMLDTGSPITLLETRTYRSLITKLRSGIGLPTVPGTLGLELCYDLSVSDPAYDFFPTLTVTFPEGAFWEWDPDNYMHTINGKLCATLAPASDVSMIGSLAQLNYVMLYDTSLNRLYYARARCDDL